MSKSTCSSTQIALIIKEFDGGKSVEEISRELGISRSTFYKWRERYDGMEASELKRVKQLEEENAKIKVYQLIKPIIVQDNDQRNRY
jgi:putative transposase